MAKDDSQRVKLKFLTLTLEDEAQSSASTVPSFPNQSLKSGMPLPQKYQKDFPTRLFGIPINEIDPFYSGKKTFVVVSRSWEIHRFSKQPSMGFFDIFKCARSSAIKTICHTLFMYFMILVMMAYTIYMAVIDNANEKTQIHRYVFLAIFTVEMNLKLIAYGFIRHPFSYFRCVWNYLDVLIVITMGLIVSLPFQCPILYAIESLRALKWIQLFPLAKSSFAAAWKNVLLLKDLIIYFIFLLLTFTLYALNSYNGHLHNRCVPMANSSQPLSLNPKDWSNIVCGNVTGATLCPENYTCTSDAASNPDYGYTTFDHFGYSAFNVFRLMTKDFWENLYEYLHEAFGPFVLVFVFTVMITGSFLFNNLLASYIAVGTGLFIGQLRGKEPFKTRVNTVPNVETEGHGHHQEDTLQSTNHRNDDSGTSKDRTTAEEEIPLGLGEVQIDVDKTVLEEGHDSTEESNKTEEIRSSDSTDLWNRTVNILCGWTCCSPAAVRVQQRMYDFLFHRFFEYFIYAVIIMSVICMAMLNHGISVKTEHILRITLLTIDSLYVLEAILKIIAATPRKYFSDGWNRLDFVVASLALTTIFTSDFVYLTSCIRILRFLRLARIWKRLGFVMKIHNVSILMVFVVFWTIASVGKFLFGQQYDKVSQRWNFRNQIESFSVVFRAVGGEWIETMWICLATSRHPWMVFIYYFTVIVIGYILLFNLFISLIMACLNTNVLVDTDHMIEVRKSPNVFQRCAAFLTRNKRTVQLDEVSGQDPNPQPSATNDVTDSSGVAPCWCQCCYVLCRCQSTPGESSRLIKIWTSVRIKATAWSDNQAWKAIVTAIIILSCIPFVISWENEYLKATVHYVISCIVTLVFTMDVVIKLTGDGCQKYFGNGRCCFDFIVTVLHITITLFAGTNAVRILRLIPRLPCLLVVGQALHYRVAILNDVLHVSVAIWLMFSILGVDMFSGSFGRCTDDKSGDSLRLYNVSSKEECLEGNYRWQNPHVNFDNVVNAFTALLQLSTMKGWINIWHSAEDITFHGYPGNIEPQIIANFYMMGFMLVGSFACLAFIVSGSIIRVNQQKKEIRGGYIDLLMTDSQRKAVAIKRRSWFMAPQKLIATTESESLRSISRIVTSSIFEGLIILLLGANAISLALTSYHSAPWIYTVIDATYITVLIAFFVETALKLLVFQRNYFKSSWNIYDFIVITTSFVNAVMRLVFGLSFVHPYFLGVLLVIRLARWLKCVRRIVHLIWICFPAIINVGLFMLVIVFFASVTANQLHGHIRPHDLHHFETFGSSFILMTEVSVGGIWDGFYAAIIDADGPVATLLLVNFLIISFVIFISCGTIIFMENYHRLYEKMRLGIGDDHLENFTKTWQIFDPEAHGTLPFDDLSDFLHYLDPPFQIAKPNEEMINDLDIPVYKDEVMFCDVLQAIMHHLDQEKIIPKPIFTEEKTTKDVSAALKLRKQLHDNETRPKWWEKICKTKADGEENQRLTSNQ